jgi:hypothetical protein
MKATLCTQKNTISREVIAAKMDVNIALMISKKEKNRIPK